MNRRGFFKGALASCLAMPFLARGAQPTVPRPLPPPGGDFCHPDDLVALGHKCAEYTAKYVASRTGLLYTPCKGWWGDSEDPRHQMRGRGPKICVKQGYSMFKTGWLIAQDCVVSRVNYIKQKCDDHISTGLLLDWHYQIDGDCNVWGDYGWFKFAVLLVKKYPGENRWCGYLGDDMTIKWSCVLHE